MKAFLLALVAAVLAFACILGVATVIRWFSGGQPDAQQVTFMLAFLALVAAYEGRLK